MTYSHYATKVDRPQSSFDPDHTLIQRTVFPAKLTPIGSYGRMAKPSPAKGVYPFESDDDAVSAYAAAVKRLFKAQNVERKDLESLWLECESIRQASENYIRKSKKPAIFATQLSIHALKLRKLEKSCRKKFEERIAVFDLNLKHDLSREKLIQDVTALFRQAAEEQSLDYVGRLNLVSDIYAALEAEINERPKVPPGSQFYASRPDFSENAPSFIGRVYKEWLTGEFTRADLRRIDAKAEMALRNWERTNGRAPLNLPTLQERNDKLVQKADLTTSAAARATHRFRSLAAKRKAPTQ